MGKWKREVHSLYLASYWCDGVLYIMLFPLGGQLYVSMVIKPSKRESGCWKVCYINIFIWTSHCLTII